MPTTHKKRDTNIEILRIIAAIFITLNHVRCSPKIDALYPNYILKQFFLCGGQFGVNLFLIIGCWFLVKVKPSVQRPIRIICETCFYAVLFNIIAFTILRNCVSVANFFKGFHYWYPFGYVVMLTLSPLLLKVSNKNCKIISLAGGGVSFVITILGILRPNLKILFPFTKGLIVGPLWFCYVFILIRTIRTIEEQSNKHISTPKIYLLGFLITYMIMFTILHKTESSWIRDTTSPMCIFSAYCLFRFFLSMKLSMKNFRHKGQINYFAKCTFAVYLFQCHASISEWLWNDFFHFYQWSKTTLFWGLYSILATVFIFIVALLSNYLLLYILKLKKLFFKIGQEPKK